MASKRKRQIPSNDRALNAGDKLDREQLDFSTWGWVGSEVVEPSQITQEHCLRACGLSRKSKHPFCSNKYKSSNHPPGRKLRQSQTIPEPNDDVIVISDDEAPQHKCSRKLCKENPNCVNYIGQDLWENEEDAWQAYSKACKLEEDPTLESRAVDLPVGLRNLGATCYANAFIQVWFQDTVFRNGVYKCKPLNGIPSNFESSPVFQLQVTFAALQMGTQSVFNPTKLVESLQLRTTEQQDAQEFSKLFMSHLDNEFMKQRDPAVRTLITDQGKHAYVTTCEKCDFRSERVSDFSEIEITLANNATLEDRIAASLSPETLTGDNKYLCPRCESLEDATRHTELQDLPPVLHFSLLRFVYDISTMERKKSKHTILFPTSLNMGRFIGPAAERERLISDDSTDIYELRGVLLHKGSSAYHGHYEAQIYDVSHCAWFQFNDEEVTKIPELGNKLNGVPTTDGKNQTKTRANGKPSVKQPPRMNKNEDQASGRASSRDAYMLIYARKKDTQAVVSPSDPPLNVLEVIKQVNATHDTARDAAAQKQGMVRANFDDLRRKVVDIYRYWNVSDADDIEFQRSVIVPRRALERWLSTDATATSLAEMTPSPAEPQEEESSSLTDSMRQHLCVHQRLDPRKAAAMKRITSLAYEKIQSQTHMSFAPSTWCQIVCQECVADIVRDRLFLMEHPKVVAEFDHLCELESSPDAYWISKAWLKAWRSNNTKIHRTYDPESDPNYNDVRCEHGELSHNHALRRQISAEAASFLQRKFPSWSPLSIEAELCATCDVLLHISKEDKKECRRKAEEEKILLKDTHDNALNGNNILLEDVPCALVPAEFVRSWRQWVNQPLVHARPESFDNSQFICEHSLLSFDPNSTIDWDSSVAVIKRTNWDILENLYPGGPLISLERQLWRDDQNATAGGFVHDIAVCSSCRLARRIAFEVTDINLRIWGPSATIEEGNFLEDILRHSEVVGRASTKFGSKSGGVQRQSKRIRQAKERETTRRMRVKKNTTVKDIKLFLQTELKIPTILQKLYHRGVDLDDNKSTVHSLHILANDIIHVQELEEGDDDIRESDDDERTAKRSKSEGGFGGTLLAGTIQTDVPSESTPPNTDDQSSSGVEGSCMRSCPTCTYVNLDSASTCEMCSHPLP